MCELRHKLRTVSKELQLAMEQEEQLKQDLHTERTAVDRLDLPAVMRMMVSSDERLLNGLLSTFASVTWSSIKKKKKHILVRKNS